MHRVIKLFILALISVSAFFLSLMLGTETISFYDILNALAGTNSGSYHDLVVGLRLPRTIVAVVCGASLSVSGVIFQAILRNPLADPFIIGVSGGASLGASIGIVAGMSYHVVALLSFIGSISTSIFVYLMSLRERFGNISLILAGVSLSFIFSSAVFFIFSIAMADQVHRAVMWMMGDLSMARLDTVFWIGPVSAVVITVSFFFRRELNAISFGDSFAYNLGIGTVHTGILFWIASSLAAISVYTCGVVGFVGLVVPHIVRKISGPDHIFLLPVSAFTGGVMLLLCDTAGRSVMPPYEIPAGVITGLAGGLFFLFYMIRGRTG